MQPKVELSRIRSLGETVDDSVLFFKQNLKPLFKAYFTICGFFLIAGLIISVVGLSADFQLKDDFESVFSTTYMLTVAFALLNFVFLVLTTFSYVALYQAKEKEAPTVEEVWVYVKYYLLRIVSSSVLLLAMVALGFVVCIVPGFYLMPIAVLIIAVMVFENAGLGYSFGQAFRLVRDKWWHLASVLAVVAVILIAATILLIVPVAIVVMLVIALTNVNTRHAEEIAVAIAVHLLQFLSLLPVIAVALTYYSFNEQKDDNGLMQRIEMLGKAQPKPNAGHQQTEEY